MSAPVILMAAPNGARRTKADHPRLPITIGETVDEAAACFKAGAAMLHAHVRDADGLHTLDAGLYRELLAEIAMRVPEMIVQITTEAVGRYTPAAQMAVARAVMPTAVSIALREIAPGSEDEAEAIGFFRELSEADIHVQHILYDESDVARLSRFVEDGQLEADCCALLVLGRYATGQRAVPQELDAMRRALPAGVSWFCCAFGPQENACVEEAMRHGGHARIGFENNLHALDGTLARDNAALVAEAAKAASGLGRPIATPDDARRAIGVTC